MTRTAIYARYSSDRQNERSAEDQVRVCRARADREGWSVVDVYSDLAISGTTHNRPGLNALLAAAEAGSFNLLLTEALDRLSRNQADIATFYQRLEFAGVRIVTLSEGEINELHIGLKGTMSALYIKDMADKVRRGMASTAAAGRIAAGLCYGYRRVIKLDPKGEPIHGLREIHPEQAEVVRRVYAEFLSGLSPRTIAMRLNRDGIPSATGGEWRVSAIVGSRARQIGILHNPIYSGRYIYNRVRMVRDPITRKRVSRVNPPSQWTTQELPDLRIVNEDSWQRVQDWRASNSDKPAREQRKPTRLLSGLVRCGACGGSFTIVSKDRMGCTRARDSGTCGNRRRLPIGQFESRVLAGLQHQLLLPEAVSLFVKEYHAEMERQRVELGRTLDGTHRRLRAADAAIARLVKAIAIGGGEFEEFREALVAAKVDRDRAQAEIEEVEAIPVIALHPQIAEQYRERIRVLGTAIASQGAGNTAAAIAIRDLVEVIHVTPREGPEGCDVTISGSLDSILTLANGQPTKRPAQETAQMVAAGGLEPPTSGL